ncbi:MAG TPA: hypothetical protein GX736_02575 [Mogibacterium sp.]|nr:hypothetical protein [Mogibacterium sp.]
MNSKLKLNDRLYGFTVTDIQEAPDAGGRLIRMQHDKTSARLCWMDNGEENKLFSVGFKTLPEDSTGVFHIIEHSVLCGSEKFPVKEPFVELLKSSMNTFLNAMTFPDKTLYPVSSRIEKDYLNLTEVYLDAVFRPLILQDSRIFYQEGHHIDTTGEKPKYKGVVFNEMKGAMSDVDRIAEAGMDKLLFPDNCYQYNSGGNPENITDLTYEMFIDAYKRSYHPSNSYFYLDGDVPLKKTLELINEYLEEFNLSDNIPEITIQKPVTGEDTMLFEATDEDSKAVVCFGKIVCGWEDRCKVLATHVLCEYLADSNESPLKRAVLSSGLAEDMELYLLDGIAQPYLMMMFRGTSPENAKQLREISEQAIRDVLVQGIPQDALTAIVNQMEFRQRQLPEPQGLYRASYALSSWLYGGDPLLYIKTGEAISELRDSIHEGFIETLAREYFADMSDFSKLYLMPSRTLGEELNEAERNKLGNILSEMSAEQRASLDKMNLELEKWQHEPDDESNLAAIPRLELNDIDKNPVFPDTKVSEISGVKILYHKLPSNGVVYLTCYFPLTDLTLEELTVFSLMPELYKELPTENYDVINLAKEIKTYIGFLSFDVDSYARDDDKSSCTPCIKVQTAFLEKNLSQAEHLIYEILFNTKLNETERIRELVAQIDEEGKRFAVSSGNKLGAVAARSHYSSQAAVSEATSGYSFLNYLHKLNTNFDMHITEFIDLISRVNKSIGRNGTVMSVTSSTEIDLSGFIDRFSDNPAKPATAQYTSALPQKLGIAVPSSVSHAVSAYDLNQDKIRPDGSLSVAANIISFSYLWNEIRVKGGAYGASISSNRSGAILCHTYRDPSPSRSLEKFAGISNFLSEYIDNPGNSLNGFIISTLSQTDPLVSPGVKGRIADDFYLSGLTNDDRIRLRNDILETTPDTLKKWICIFRKLAEAGSICVVGPESELEQIDNITVYRI